ncbi:MAG: hypothetical protein RIR26_1959 [Pseudomonadota bacterium]
MTRRPLTNQTRKVGTISSVAILMVSCSVKNEEIKLNSDLKPVSSLNAANSANAVMKNGDAAFGLLSPIPFKTYLNSFVTNVRGSEGSEYRFVLMDGFSAACTGWSDFRKISEPLKLAFGQEGPKTLCLQNKEKDGKLANPVIISLRKNQLPENGPEYALKNSPPPLTYKLNYSVTIDSQEVAQYRALVKAGDSCGTLEAEPWKNIGEPITANANYDGDWVLCLDVRDKFGNKNKTPHAHVWTLDTTRPVLDPLILPSGDTLPDTLSFDVTGNKVDFYQSALIAGESDCSNAPYESWKARSVRLSVPLPPQDGTWTLCMQSAKSGYDTNPNSSDYIQQKPSLLVIKKSSIKATVEILPVPVSKDSAGNIKFAQQERLFKMGGTNVTHYKARTLDYSDNDCSQWDMPESDPVPVATPLSWTMSAENSGNSAIKTLCVWGLRNIGSEWMAQEKPTHIRFYNDTISTTRIPDDPALAPYSISQAVATCSCHDAYTSADFTNNAVRISTTLRTGEPKPMPVGGWRSEDQRRRMLKFLYSLPGYPQDLPQVLQQQ